MSECISETQEACVSALTSELTSVNPRLGKYMLNKKVDNTIDLSPMQKAYWIGAKRVYPNSCVGFVRSEYKVEKLNVKDLENAIAKLCQTFDILRLTINDEGLQSFQSPQPYRLIVYHNKFDQDIALDDDVKKIFGNDSGENLVVHLKQGDDVDWLSISARLTCVDGRSYNKLVDYLGNFYYNPESADVKIHQYPEYIHYLSQRTNSRIYRKSKRYWENNIKGLPLAPSLPLLGGGIENSSFKRFSLKLNPECWGRLKSQCKKKWRYRKCHYFISLCQSNFLLVGE